ncbi:hypothetical protein CVT24_000715 [Panaeolus cyanescens]|uniref:Aquaporin n=1 Tax=Panaeolus cyanescens TaxID=181874 RepID=A0A409YT81_9AGAR|nr:hypothetical protein CVT24_000715 [Panaeolus cyanescens]
MHYLPGLGLGIWISIGVSGGHVNPSITLALAARRGFPWRKVPIYIMGQIIGAVIGAALSWSQYSHAINIVEDGGLTGSTASLFATYALPYVTAATCFFSEFLGTGVLAFVLFMTMDKRNLLAPPHAFLPLVAAITLLALGVSLGMQTGKPRFKLHLFFIQPELDHFAGFGFNPARDLGTRIFLSMAGYGPHVWSYRRQYWLWTPIMGSTLGALVAVSTYDLFLREWSIETSPSSQANLTDQLAVEVEHPV